MTVGLAVLYDPAHLFHHIVSEDTADLGKMVDASTWSNLGIEVAIQDERSSQTIVLAELPMEKAQVYKDSRVLLKEAHNLSSTTSILIRTTT